MDWNRAGRFGLTRKRAGLVVPCVGLLIALVLPELPLGTLAASTSMRAHLEREAFFWAITFVLLAYVLQVERRPVASIGLRLPTGKSIAFGIAVGVFVVTGIVAIFLSYSPRCICA